MTRHALSAALLLLIFPALSSCKQEIDPPKFEAQKAYALLIKQCEFGPRVPNTEAHTKALAWFLAYFDSLGIKTEKQEFAIKDPYSKDTLRLTNIIARFNPELNNRILLCAHWDSRPRSEQDRDTSKRHLALPAANDGASGVAVLMQLAASFKASPIKSGVDLVLLDGEDWGKSGDEDYYCLGAKEFARRSDHTKYDYAIVLDMVGDSNQLFFKEGLSQRYNPELVEKIWSRAESIGLKDYFDKRVTEAIYDDHVPLLTASIKAIDIIDFDYPAWHTAEDTPDKCAAESLDHVGTLMLSLVTRRI